MNKYILKSEFCNKYNIKLNNFTKILVDKGFLKRQHISGDYISGHYGYAVTKKGEGKFLKCKGGSWQQGPYKYNENYFKKVFEITDEINENDNLSNTELSKN